MYAGHLSDPDLAEAARLELGETTAVREASLLEFRRELLSLPATHRPRRIDDAYLFSYLRPCKYRVPKALAKAAAHTDFVAELVRDGVLQDPDPERLPGEMFRELIATGCFYNTPQVPKNGCRVCCVSYHRLRSLEPLRADPTLLLKWQLFCLERVRHDPYLQVHGLVLLNDFGNLSFRDALSAHRALKPHLVQHAARFSLRCVPFRVRALIYLDPPPWFNLLWAVMKPFLSDKIRKRVHFVRRGKERIVIPLVTGNVKVSHKPPTGNFPPGASHGCGVRSLDEILDLDTIPEDFGGRLKMSETERLAVMMQWLDQLTEESKEFLPDQGA